jgi:hypothetical protein
VAFDEAVGIKRQQSCLLAASVSSLVAAGKADNDALQAA